MHYSTDHDWFAWLSVQAQALRLVTSGNHKQAAEEIDVFLKHTSAPDLLADVLAFRAMIRERQGENASAKTDLQEARSLAPQASYRRYTIELTIGGIFEKEGISEEAASWYLKALETVAQDPTTSGASALLGLLAAKDLSSLAQETQELCQHVARQSWRLFQLPGEPDMTDLPKVVKVLLEASTRPLPQTRSDYPDS